MESGLQIILHDMLALIRNGQWQESEDIEDMNNTISKCELIDIYRMPYPTIENAFFSIVRAGFIWLEHNREGYSKYLNKYHKNKELKSNVVYLTPNTKIILIGIRYQSIKPRAINLLENRRLSLRTWYQQNFLEGTYRALTKTLKIN